MTIRKMLIPVVVFLMAVAGCGSKSKVELTSESEIEQAQPPAGSVVTTAVPEIETETAKAGSQSAEKHSGASEEGAYGYKEGLVIADFEEWPNNLGGEIGVYGSLEPDWEQVNQMPMSWVYDPVSLNYMPENVHSGKSAFRLVNGLGVKSKFTWGSFSMDMGPTIDITTTPKKVISLDASNYSYLVFWAKGEKGGEKMEFLIRDAHALNYSPQVNYKLPDLTNEWKRIAVPLSDIAGKVDLSKLDNIGLAFGKDIGNVKGDIAYIDDFVLTNTLE